MRYIRNAFANSVNYRKWQQSSVDLSNLPIGTNVSVNFEVGGCTQGGHWGYAYVDAECSSSNFVTSNMCSGSSFALLVAPQGLVAYQWLDTSNNPIASATNDTLIVTSPTIGDVYSFQVTSLGGCVTTLSVAISTSTISINNITVVGSCVNGASGSVAVYPIGSNAGYTYTWTSISTGSVVGNGQTVLNLPPGNYSVAVSSLNCGQATATVSVPIAPPQLIQMSSPYCGNSAFIATVNGTNYQWYNGSTIIPAPLGINDTLFINNPSNNAPYTVVYTNASGCKDSVLYRLNVVPSSSVFFNNITNVCVGGSNGAATINLNPINSAPYNFSVMGNSGVITNTNTSSTTLTLNNLSAGVYTVTVIDGFCISVNPFVIYAIPTNYTITPGAFSSCNPSDTARLILHVGNNIPSACGLSSSGSCTTPNSVQVGFGTATNNSTSWPSVYGNWYKNARHQLLFTATELNAAGILPGKISSLAFDIISIPSGYIGTIPGLSISLKCTSATTLTNIFDNAGLIQVYGGVNYTPIVGWNTHTFTTPYEWDGASNILVDVCYAWNGSSSYSSNPFNTISTTATTQCVYAYSDIDPLCLSTTAIPTATTSRPNVKFENCGSVSVSSFSVAVSSNGTLVQNYNNDSLKIVPVITPSAGIVYTITITNSNGCSTSIPYNANASPTILVIGTNTVCSGSSANYLASGASTYTWNTGALTPSMSIIPIVNSTYTVTGKNLNNCIATETVAVTVDNTCQDVWPGDAISDGIANNIDVLELGLHYLQTGTPRASTSNLWQSYFATNWVGTITNGKNVNHSNCNGDGIINDDDTLAIFDNYGLTHAFKPTAQPVTNPQLTIVPDQVMVAKGTWGTFSIYAGDATTSITNVNGVAFTATYDNTLIETDSVWIDYPTSFINASNQNLKFRKRVFVNGKLYTATTHTINGNVSGNGKIATLHYKIKSTLTTDNVLSLSLTRAYQSNASGTVTPLTIGSATLMAIGASVGIDEIINGTNISIYPNPAKDLLTIGISTPLDVSDAKLEITNALGQVILTSSLKQTTTQMNIQQLSSGVYFVEVKTSTGVLRKKFVKE